ncbi:MAG: hypothetical protein JRG96_01610 [Deltaproteobacteria bacterium]|nr:hypothetical protein [Deltaproteobacteria bacterium]MBW2418823.1 hypothetical protein [Deltaproteobacteria bacterium]
MTSHHYQSTCEACPVCGSTTVETDRVECRGELLLGECLRCEHRWTRALGAVPLQGSHLQSSHGASAPQARGAWTGDREVASAA